MHSSVNTLKLNGASLPLSLTVIDRPPRELFYSGIPLEDWLDSPKVGIVGSRKMSPYGSYTTELFATELARAGVIIISGLAYGVDASAHKSALAAGGKTVAVLPTAIENIYPTSHLNLSRQILENGGLMSEYQAGDNIYKSNFTDRNRLIAGLADALLITEAAVNSGSLHTARYALEQGKTVMAVPGNINSPGSEGCNNLIKSGALAITNLDDIFTALKLKNPNSLRRNFSGSKNEQKIFHLISEGVSDQEELALQSRLDAAGLSSALTGLEINGYIRPLGAGQWSL